MWCIYNEILFSHKNNEVVIHVITWINLENTMLREINPSQKYSVIEFI